MVHANREAAQILGEPSHAVNLFMAGDMPGVSFRGLRGERINGYCAMKMELDLAPVRDNFYFDHVSRAGRRKLWPVRCKPRCVNWIVTNFREGQRRLRLRSASDTPPSASPPEA